MSVIENEKLVAQSESWQLMRISMAYESEEFRRKNEIKYVNKSDFRKALHRHLNKKFRPTSDVLMAKQGQIWGMRPKNL